MLAVVLANPFVCGQAIAQQATDAVEGSKGPYWYAAAGTTGLIVDFGEGGYRGLGLVMAGGISWQNMETGIVASVWPNIQDSRISSIQAQGSLPFAFGTGTALELTVATGYAWYTYLGEVTGVADVSGPNASLGLRFRANSASGWGGRAGAFMRTDAGGWNGEWRVLVSKAQQGEVLSPESSSDLDFGVRLYHMIPVGGPWEFVGPGYAVYARRPITPDLNASLTLALFHWQIPGQAFMRGYLWDTRSFVALPAGEWSLAHSPDVNLRAGPAIVTMGEGPDNGVTLGPDLEVEVGFGLLGWNARIGTGWMWILRRDNDPLTAGDQHGWMLFGGVDF